MPTISFGGVASGLDTGSIVAQLVALRRRPIDRLQQQKSDLQSGLKILEELQENLKKLGEVAARLDTSAEFASKAALSGDEGLFSASATSQTPLGSYSVEVQSLAQTHREVSESYAANTDSVGTGVFRFTLEGVTTEISLAAGADSLVDLKEAINAADAGITATIMNDGTGYRLLLSAQESGAAHQFTVDSSGLSGGATPAFTNNAIGADAIVLIDGVQVLSSSNVIEGALEGLTLELKSEGRSATLSIETDSELLQDTLQELVDAYNAVATAINDQSVQGSPLNGSSLLRTVQTRLAGAISQPVDTGGSYRIAAEVGLSLDRNGALSLDADKLQKALATDYQSVVGLFVEGTATVGVAQKINDTVDALTDFAAGLFRIRENGIDDQIRGIDRRIESEERSVELYEELLNRKFSAMELAISRLQNQSGFLSSWQL